MVAIVPTITAENAHIYREQVERVQSFASRIHIDLMDGMFTTNQSVQISQVWWPEGITADIHLMYENPEAVIDELIALKPRTVVVHAESGHNLAVAAQKLSRAGIVSSIALLPETTVESVSELLTSIQQVLIFSGNLGHQGGSSVDFALLEKVAQVKAINPAIEIAWDGGVNESNIQQIISAGVDIINVGSYIQAAQNPALAYEALSTLLA